MNETAQITLYGTTWCGGSRRTRLLLDQHQIPYRWVDIDADKEAAKYIESLNHSYRSVPTLVWPDGSCLVEPSEDELTRKLGITP
ncbi:MAG: glutaredoxin family protein [Chloroflexota bacterium]